MGSYNHPWESPKKNNGEPLIPESSMEERAPDKEELGGVGTLVCKFMQVTQPRVPVSPSVLKLDSTTCHPSFPWF